VSQAQAELSLINARQGQADHDLAGASPRLQSLTTELNRDGRRILLPLLGAAALVLLIACGNVAVFCWCVAFSASRSTPFAQRSVVGGRRCSGRSRPRA